MTNRRQFQVIVCGVSAVLVSRRGATRGWRAGMLQRVRREGGDESEERGWGNRGRGGTGAETGTKTETGTERHVDGRSKDEQ